MTVTALPEWPRHWHHFSVTASARRENIVTLREEFNNIENYFLIQSYRFDDKFSFEILAAPEDRRRIRA